MIKKRGWETVKLKRSPFDTLTDNPATHQAIRLLTDLRTFWHTRVEKLGTPEVTPHFVSQLWKCPLGPLGELKKKKKKKKTVKINRSPSHTWTDPHGTHQEITMTQTGDLHDTPESRYMAHQRWSPIFSSLALKTHFGDLKIKKERRSRKGWGKQSNSSNHRSTP